MTSEIHKEGFVWRLITDIGMFVVIFIIAIEAAYFLRVIQTKHALEKSPVVYGELIPDKEDYAPGELIGFNYDRICTIDDKELPLLMLTVDSFENLSTGEVFSGTFASRIVLRNGTEHLRATRRLSPDCTPGTYSFEGWVSIQGAFPTQPVPYYSRKFKVR